MASSSKATTTTELTVHHHSMAQIPTSLELYRSPPRCTTKVKTQIVFHAVLSISFEQSYDMQSGFHRKELGLKEIHENPTVEKLKESVKVAWGNVALWKHRYTKECRRREALEKKLKTLASMDESSAHVDECLNLKKVAFAALETCSIKDEEISALRRKMCLLMRDINELTGLVTAHTRKRANAKIVRLLKYQLDLELEKSTLQLQNNRLSTEVMKLRSMFDECTKTKASMCVGDDVSRQLTHCNNTALIQLRHRAEVERAESEVEKIRQELTVTNMKLESCQEKLVQLREHNQRQEAQLTAQTTELESCRQREQELRRSFAQKLQSLEMVLTASQCAFASRERELLKQLSTSGDKQD